jgi:two-component system phosphate regulon response regulator PhoB/two-component system alkaline phosphatase synthesis response regulator PhoP
MTNKLIVSLDDEADILELISVNLKKAGFESACFEYVDEFWSFLEKQIPALIILDLMLNNADGFEICKLIRSKDRYKNIPIIMLTAKNEETDKIVGLEIGADDYITKPFSPRELIARIKVILRRGERNDTPVNNDIMKIGKLIEIDLNKFEVLLEGKKLDLTPTEFKILKFLAEKQGWVFNRDQILDYLWGTDKIVVDRTIDVHIKNLREKLGKAGEYIKNIRGIGYKFEI